jgi:enamine deaminase RidA (YjgF/YER057c/UK114 family)
MPVERKTSRRLAEPPGYSHVATVTDARLVFVAGQVPLDEAGELVGPGDPLSQAEQCLRNVTACLKEAGARPEDVVRTTVYVVAEERATLGRVWRTLLESEHSELLRAPATLLGVAHLGYEGQLVEIECTAAVPLETSSEASNPSRQ